MSRVLGDVFQILNGNVGLGTTVPRQLLDIQDGNGIISGNLGIGTTDPQYAIDANGDINFTGILRQSGTPYISSQWTTTGTDIYYSSGNVGVGTTAPLYAIDADGDINFTGILRQSGTPYISSQWTTSSNNIYYSNGYVGIGTVQPNSKLHIFSSNASESLFKLDTFITTSLSNYPPVAFNSSSVVVSGQPYGNGTYTVSASSYYVAGNHYPYYVFDGVIKSAVSKWLSSSSKYNTSSGIYIGAAQTVHTGGTVYGEWLQLQLPTYIQPISYSIAQYSAEVFLNRTPYAWYLLGSSNASTWVLLDTIDGYTTWDNDEFYTFNLSISTPYLYYRWVFNKIQPSNDGLLSINEMRLTTDSSIPISSIYSSVLIIESSGNIGIGTTVPRELLDIRGGNAIVSGSVGVGTTIARQKLDVQGGSAIVSANIGIGTTSPLQSLHVQNKSYFVDNVGIGTTPTTKKLYVQGGTLLNGPLDVSNIGDTVQPMKVTGNSYGIAEFVDSSSVSALKISATRNVGIGTILPLKTLHVIGDVLTTGTITASNLTVLGDTTILNTISSNTEQMVITNAGTGPALKVTQSGDNSVAEFYDNESGLALMIANNGNIGIGSTTPYNALDINGNLYINGTISTNNNNIDAGSGTVTAATFSGTATQVSQDLTRGTYLIGDNYNGSVATTWAVDADSAAVANKVVVRDASGNFSAGTITADLSGTATQVSQDLTRGTYLIGDNYNGSVAMTWSVDADSTAVANKIVVRDASGNFSAGTITATLSGTATQVSQDLTRGTYLIGDNYNGSVATTWAVDADSAAVANKVVVRDASGNFSAGTITADLSGTATQVSQNLTRGTYLTGANYNGSVATTWAVDADTAATANKVVVRDASAYMFASGVGIGTTTARQLLDVQGGHAIISGNLGIGTTNPTVRLSVGTGPSDVTSTLMFNSGDTATNTDKLYWTYIKNGSRIGHNGGWNVNHYAGQSNTSAAPSNGNFHFFTGGPEYNERLTILNNGNIGIGSTQPAYRLDVAGNAYINGAITTNNNNINAGTGTVTAATFSGTATKVSNDLVRGTYLTGTNYNGAGTTTWAVDADSAAVANKVVVRDASGMIYAANVGVGTTSALYAVDVVGDVNFTGILRQSGTPYVSSQWTTSGSAVYYNSGNVGIGVTNPMTELDVNGTIQTTNIRVLGRLTFGPNDQYNDIQVAPIRKIFYTDTDSQTEFILIKPGIYGGVASNIQVFVGNNLLSYYDDTIKDYNLSVTYGLSNTIYTITLTEPIDYASVVDITVWPTILPSSLPQGNVQQTIIQNILWTETNGDIYYTNGNVGIGTTDTSLGKLVVEGNIVPSACNVYDLGSSNLRWRDLYLSGNTIDLGGTRISQDTNTGGIRILNRIGTDVDVKGANLYASTNIGIGTTLARHKLDVQGGDAIISGSIGIGTTVPRTALDIYGGNAIISGNVGIGTSAPYATLHVVGNILTTGTITASNISVIGDYVILNTITSNTEQIVVTNAGTGPALKVTQTGIQPIAEFYDYESGLAMTIANNGNIGIGTTAPQSLLDVNGNVRVAGLFSKNQELIQKDPVDLGTAGWYIIGTFEGTAGSRMELKIFGASGYSAYDASPGGYILLTVSINDNTLGFIGNCSGTFSSYGGAPAITQFKLVQNGANRFSHKIYAYVEILTKHTLHATISKGSTFTEEFTSTTDPGSTSGTLQSALHVMSTVKKFVGIGTTSPTAVLHVQTVGVNANQSIMRVDDNNSGTTPFIINDTGKVGIGTTNPQAPLHVNGSTLSTNYFIQNTQIRRILVGYQFTENGSQYSFNDAINIWKNTFSSTYVRSNNNSRIEVVLKPCIAFAIGAVGITSYGKIEVQIEFTYPNGTKEYSGVVTAWQRIDNSFYEIELTKKLVYTLSISNNALLASGQSISALIQVKRSALTGTFTSFGLGIWGGKSSIKFKEYI